MRQEQSELLSLVWLFFFFWHGELEQMDRLPPRSGKSMGNGL